MKGIILLPFVFLAAIPGIFGQGFYFNAGLGYAFSQAGQSLDGTGVPYSGTRSNSASSSAQAYNIDNVSFSAGFYGNLGVGYMFTEHVGVQLDGEIGLSMRKYTFTDLNVSYGGVPSNETVTQQAKAPFIVIPSLVVQTGGDQINVYSRFGVALPLNTQITEDLIAANLPGTGAISVDDFTFRLKNSFSLGMAAAAGVKYKLNDHVSLWGEVSLLSLSCYIKEADLVAVTSGGRNISLSQVSGPQVLTFSKNATVDSTGTQYPTYSQPFSNVGVHLGVSFLLSGSHNAGRRDDHIDRPRPSRFQ